MADTPLIRRYIQDHSSTSGGQPMQINEGNKKAEI